MRATINLGHDMGLRVVAEGIEDVETLDLLGDSGVTSPRGTSSVDRRPRVDSHFQPSETRKPRG